MSINGTNQPTYEDGRTKQTFRDETDINKILKRAQVTGTVSHLAKHEGRYGDFSNYDFFANTLMLTKGREIFDDLPSEVRAEFNQSPAGFFQFVNDPANRDRLNELLPALAEPGRQNLPVSQTPTADADTAATAAAITEAASSAASETTPEPGEIRESQAPKVPIT